MKKKKKERTIGRLPSKAILRNFLNHFETLESRRKYDADDDLYQREFQSMKELTETLKTDIEYSCSEGLKEVNRHKNRYKDILPYDYTRVILSEYPGVPGSDYINANYVRGSSGSSCAYIASQGPLPNSVVDFWRMIWESEVTVIVMACNETESGKYKCECYWPDSSETQQQYGNITVEIVKWRQVCPDFLVRTLKITSDSKTRIVCQFHYTTWPDHGVPSTVQPILELVRLMRDVQPTETRPILIHCSAGCGRTGTICCIDFVWTLLRSGNLREDFSLYNIICDMRKQRIAMVQTQEQYMLCYRAVAALIEQRLKLMDAHTYENVDEDGKPLMLNSLGSAEEDNEESNSSSSSSTASGNDSESECAENLTVEPTKDVKHLIDSWNINNIRNQEKEINSMNDSFSQSSTSSVVDSKQEKLIGKATVIRRPSIAKLKALFENIQSTNVESDQDYNRASRSVTLHRSFSTRERSSTMDKIDTNSNIFDFPCSDLTQFSTSSFTLNQIKSKTLNRNKNKSSQFRLKNMNILNQEKDQNNFKNNASSKSTQNEINSDFKNNNEKPSSQGISSDNKIYSKQSIQQEPIYSSNPLKAPPKPPRTYQYPIRIDRSYNDSPAESSTGGGLGAASSTSNSSGKYSDANRVPESFNQQKSSFESEIYSFGNYNTNNQNYYTIDKQSSLYRSGIRNASESNLYEPTIPTNDNTTNVRKELSKSSYYLTQEPIYYEPPVFNINKINNNNNNNNNLNNNNNNADQNSSKERNLKRDLSVPMLSVPPRLPIPHNLVPKHINGEMKPITGSNVTSSNLIHSLPKYSQRFDQKLQHTNPYQQRRPVPMNYVRPQIQPNVNNSNYNNNNNNNNKGNNNNGNNIKNNSSNLNFLNNNKGNIFIKNGNTINSNGLAKSATVASLVTPANNKQLDKEQLTRSKSTEVGNQETKSKTCKSNKSANEATSTSLNTTSSQQVKKQGNAFVSFFSFGRKKKSKQIQNTTTGPIQPCLTNTVQPIRPPHSHRFSPPTQWTQV